jgi:hypothetical protein
MELESDLSLTDSVHIKRPARFATFKGRAGATDAAPGSRMETLTEANRIPKSG